MMKPSLFSISMFNSVSLQEKLILEQFLEVLECNDNFIPNDWGNDERIHKDYNHNEIVEKIILDSQRFSDIHLRRSKPVKYKGSFKTELNARAFLDFDFEKTLSPKYWQFFFELSDEIAKIVKPRYGVTHIFWPPPIPWKDERECMHRWMNICAQPTPVKFIEHGPMGVGLRTYFSNDIMEMFGKEFLLKTPAVVSELNWGGICIDLVEKPWEADFNDILDSWIRVMNYLKSHQVLAIPTFDEQCRGVFFDPSIAWENKMKMDLL